MKNIKSMALLLMSVLMAGCVAAVAVGAAAGMVVYDRRSISTLESDARIFHVVHKTIVTDPRFKNSRVLVTSFNDVVLLVGETPTASLRVLAEKIARDTPNVRRVYNELAIEYPIPYSQRPKDTWITSQVRTQMLTTKGLESGSIRIVTENAVVYLLGIATPEQANLSVSVARHVPGVRKVVKVFQYIT